VTWNFGHLANVRRQARIRLFNTAAGFYVPMIVTPEFLVSEATEKVSWTWCFELCTLFADERAG